VSTPALTEDRIYFGGRDGLVYALDAQSGKQIWQKDLGARISTSVALHGHDLYVGTAKRELYRLDRDSGEVLGRFATEVEPRGPLLVTANSLTVFLGDDVLANTDLALKKLRWSAEASQEWTSARPYLWHETVLAGNRRELVAF
jgi:eukaryotic-like serine/threonine-protein kinase